MAGKIKNYAHRMRELAWAAAERGEWRNANGWNEEANDDDRRLCHGDLTAFGVIGPHIHEATSTRCPDGR